MHLTKDDIEQASATVEDEVPNLDTEVKVDFPPHKKRHTPRVYLPADA